MPSSTSNFERPIPALPWRSILWSTLLLILAGTLSWELYARSLGYRPTLNDTSDLWADRREAVRSDSVVIIGDSRSLFDLDLPTLAEGLGKRPVQLGLVGSCAYPILENLANDENFHGTVLCSLIPAMWLAPAGPPVENSKIALRRYAHRTVAQRASSQLGMWLENCLAFLKQDDLALPQLLKRIVLTDRAVYHAPPRLPPYFSTLDGERNTHMTDAAASPGPLQERIKQGWLPLFTPPPPPNFVPREAFLAGMQAAVEGRFAATATAVKKIKARGGQVIFLRLPVTGELKKHEDKITPRQGPWNRILKESEAPGIYFEDFPELASFTCPEWSHLSASDSVEFSKRLIPHLKTVLKE